jgi:hypothetical protein
VRLKAYLTDRGITPELERDFVDVQWKQDGRNVIGEVELTAYLSRDEAFRTALGQLLVCAFCQLLHPPCSVLDISFPIEARLLL